MCFVVVTCRSLLWTLLSLVATLMVVASVITPQWMIGQPRKVGLATQYEIGNLSGPIKRMYQPTLGIYNRCTRLHKFGDFRSDSCAPYVTSWDMEDEEFPHVWKATLLCFMIAGCFLTFTLFTSVLSLCFRSLCGKSIFTVTGLIQSTAGLFLIFGLILFPAGWGTRRVRNLCGLEAGPYVLNQCSLGWAFYGCIGGTLMIFGCAVLSIQADNATSSEKVENQLVEGNNPVCVL